MAKSKTATPPNQDKDLVKIKCQKCGDIWARCILIPSDEGIRQYSCNNCRYTWTIKASGPVFNF